MSAFNEAVALFVAEQAYRCLCCIPHDTNLRIKAQPALCALRDLIAEASGRDSEEVQVSAEAIALLHRLGVHS